LPIRSNSGESIQESTTISAVADWIDTLENLLKESTLVSGVALALVELL